MRLRLGRRLYGILLLAEPPRPSPQRDALHPETLHRLFPIPRPVLHLGLHPHCGKRLPIRQRVPPHGLLLRPVRRLPLVRAQTQQNRVRGRGCGVFHGRMHRLHLSRVRAQLVPVLPATLGLGGKSVRALLQTARRWRPMLVLLRA